MTTIDIALNRLERDLDKTTATLLVTDDPEKRHLIVEGLLVGAALFLLQEYCAGFLEGIGFKDAAKAHGMKAREFIVQLRSSSLSKHELEQKKIKVESAIQEVQKYSTSDGSAFGEGTVRKVL
jgi:hypothetical protein